MAKICAKENCRNPVFSHAFCRYHQFARTDKPKKEYIRFDAFFNDIYLRSDRRCSENPKEIIYNPRDWNFHHVLPRRIFEEFARDKRNIILLSQEAHDHWEINDFEHRKKMKIWEQCRNIALELLNELPENDNRRQKFLAHYNG